MFRILLILCMTASLWAGEIYVQITALKNTQGDVYIGLYHQPKNFLNTRKAYKRVKLKAKKSLTYRFRSVPLGSYAIAVYHDANSNGKLDRNLLGIPNESTGTSHNVVSHFGPPSFEKAKFKHHKYTKLTIRMR